jgi:hypothetical protein
LLEEGATLERGREVVDSVGSTKNIPCKQQCDGNGLKRTKVARKSSFFNVDGRGFRREISYYEEEYWIRLS